MQTQGEIKAHQPKTSIISADTEIQRTPCIFNYLNYRKFLKDFYSYKKSANKRYSYSIFSLKAGLKSPNFLALVISGTRNITSNNILGFAKALALTDLETVYWENLVAFNQAKTEQQRRHYLVKLAHSPTPEGATAAPIREIRDEWDYYSSWHHAAIRELTLFDQFTENPSEIARLLKNRISAAQARESLELLERMRFLVRDERGRLVQAERQVRYFSVEDIRNIVIQRFHQSTGELALSSLEQDEASERDFSGLTIGVSQEDLPRIKAKITQFRKELNEEFSRAKHADVVLQINLQVIPVTGGRTQS